MTRFSDENFYSICEILYQRDADLAMIKEKYGHPPMWTRPATFQTLILTILEQQVSLASAYAAFKKLRQRIGIVTPQKLLKLSDDELRACYFSRQKIIYARELAHAVISKQLSLRKLSTYDDELIRTELKKIKGIGDWTVDVYMMHALQKLDVFPVGDLALVNSIKEVKNLSKNTSKDELLKMSEQWKPYRTVASMILWHSYIKKRKIKLEH